MARETQGRGRWLGRAAVTGWLALGAFAAWMAPEADPISPDLAERLFGEARSAQSSAPDGLMALAQTLERLGFSVGAHTHAEPPDADLLVLLAPQANLEEAEIESLLAWVHRGGHLIYAPAWITLAVSQKETDEDEIVEDGDGPPTPGLDVEPAATETDRIEIDDALLAAIPVRGRESAVAGDSATLWQIGAGSVAVVAEGGHALCNAALRERGLEPELPWLRVMLAGVEAVAFDEGRVAGGAPEGLTGLLRRSRFAPAILLAFVALLLSLLARGARRVPALPEPPAGGRDYGEHLDAVAGLLHRSSRVAIARRYLVRGTRRRLGPLAETPRARAVLSEVEARLAGLPSPVETARQAEALRRLEAELLEGR